MASAETIIFNYTKAIAQADELLDISKNVKKMADGKFTDSIAKVDKNWDGDNSKKYLAKCNQLKDKMGDSASDIQKISDSIRKIAKAIYDAEMANIEIAKTRSYK